MDKRNCLPVVKWVFVFLTVANIFLLLKNTSILVKSSIRDELSSSLISSLHTARNPALVEQMLENTQISFYIYDDAVMKQNQSQHRRKKVVWNRYKDEILYDEKALSALLQSPLRSSSPDNVTFFIVPTPVGKVIASKTLRIQDAMNALVNHEIFKRTKGNNHLILSSAFVTFRRETIFSVKALAQYYGKLRNVTIASSHDEALAISSCDYAKSFVGGYEFFQHGNGKICDQSRQAPMAVVDRYASIGLGDSSEDFPIVQASMTKFQLSEYSFFYRSREGDDFMNNSTVFRNRILGNISENRLQDAAIGYSEPDRRKWIHEYTSSKFCLVLRGDSPNSHALFRSVRAGCIPCIISDTYPIYVSR